MTPPIELRWLVIKDGYVTHDQHGFPEAIAPKTVLQYRQIIGHEIRLGNGRSVVADGPVYGPWTDVPTVVEGDEK